MRVLVIGNGAREHALVARLAADRDVSDVVCTPGNPGISTLARTLPSDLSEPDQLLAIADREQIDLTVVGPELPLSLGVVNAFERENLAIVGPTAEAARLESSKAFSKAFMARHRVPTARFRTCETLDAALAAVRSGEFGPPVVIKADGLAAGKGVVVAEDVQQAEAAITASMAEKRFGDAGATVVVEECLIGPEVSFFVLSDGRHVMPLGTAQDHKRVFDDDRGPNTGGMGAFAPSSLIDAAQHRRIMNEIVGPVIAGMAQEGYPFRGFLYAGLMMTAAGPKVIEFNARLGDPEAQVVLPSLEDSFLAILVAAASGRLNGIVCRQTTDKLVGVVLASEGYPDSVQVGRPIAGIADAERLPGVSVFHAGTARRDGQLITAGGRVLTVVGRGADFSAAIERAYAGVQKISFQGMQYRRDIGRKAVAT
jgi:phosphoribosylamine--glycine ligase